jgi:hypothetical protein
MTTHRKRGLYALANAAVEQPVAPPVTVKGAAAIAEVLGVAPKDVYRLYEAHQGSDDGPPIRKVPGIGLSGDLTALRAWRAKIWGTAA